MQLVSSLRPQVENEYGYWGIDPDYLEKLRRMMLPSCSEGGYVGSSLGSATCPRLDTLGSECPLLFTSDGTFWPDLQAQLWDLVCTCSMPRPRC